MKARKRDHKRPSAQDICIWIADISLFIKADSILKYLAGVRYHLAPYGTADVTRNVLVNRVVRGLFKTYGFSQGDDREPITVFLMIKVLKSVNTDDHNERCYAAALVIGFLNCLRIGEFTISRKGDTYLKRADWHQVGNRGSIRLKRCKTDVFGRGHDLKFRKMNSVLDPIFWLGNYARRHSVSTWTSDPNAALFVLADRTVLDRARLIKWFRSKATPWCKDPSKLNGISFRKGGAQALREQGFSMEELGVLGRWLTTRVAARYVKLTDPIVDRFANAFDTAATTAGDLSEHWRKTRQEA